MRQIVKYNNDFNLMPTPNLTAKEMDIFMLVVSKLQYEKRELELDGYEFFKSLKEPKDGFESLLDAFNKFAEKILNFNIKYNTKTTAYAFVCFEKVQMDFTTSKVKIKAQEDFYNMIINCNLGYTRFELLEFTNLSGKYTKTLYRLLKQFRNTGFMRMEREEFLGIMDIPQNKTMGDIDKFILKPAIKELTKPRNLFDIERVPFKNLKYTKIKGKGRGRGGNVVAIEFRFDIENLEQELLESNHFFDESFRVEVMRAKGNYLSKNGEWLYINNALCIDSKIILNLYNKDTHKDFKRTYTKDEYEKEIKPFIVSGNMQKVF